MKRIIIMFLLWVTFIVPVSMNGQDITEFTSGQLTLRNDLFDFLKEEGFMPKIDVDEDIEFKSEGQQYYIKVSKTDDNPMYVVLYRQFNFPEEYSAETVIMASNELNIYKGVKVLCFVNQSYIRIGAELFVRNAEPVKEAFYKLKVIIDNVASDFIDECEKVGTISPSNSEIPFIITDIKVANVESDGDIIQDYGSTIYDYKTKYLKPKIKVKPYKTSGTYTVYVKMYKDGTLSTGTSSPKGYSYSATITLSGSQLQEFTLSGWGSKTAGHWAAGEYRFEIWYGDYCIGSKRFNII